MTRAETPAARPKYRRITDSLRRGIRRGKWTAGDRLPTCRELTEQFGVTPMTVWRALDELEKEDLVYRVQGSGTYVSEPTESPETDLVGMIMQTAGDTFGRIYGQLLRQLGAAHRHAIATDIGGYDHPPEQRRAALQRFLDHGLNTLIVDGRTFTPFPLLRDWHRAGGQLTFLLRCETTLAFPDANQILSDWELGGRLVAEHLLGLGPRKLLVVSHAYPGAATPSLGPEYQYHWDMLRGIKSVLAAAGLSADGALRIVLDAPQTDADSEIRQALRDGYHGVFCLGDFRAPKVYAAAAAEGLKVGRDVAVCGYYNTPWVSSLHPQLTSVEIREDLLATTAAEAVENGWQGERVLVPPKLHERESTTDV